MASAPQKIKCRGHKTNGDPCPNWAMRGQLVCHAHGGRSPQAKAAAQARQSEERAREAVVMYGLPRDISPTDALLEEVRYTAGHVAWLRERVAELEQNDLVWGVTDETDKQASEFPGTDTTRAAKPNVWLQLYREERKHLLDVTKAAISVGIEERRVKLAEAQGAILNGVLRRIFARLDLSPAQSALLPLVVPEELRRAAATASPN